MQQFMRNYFEDKIYRLQQRDRLQRMLNYWRSTGKSLVFTNGCFDIIHRGHIEYLAQAAELGNTLLVGVNTDSSVKKLKGDTRPLNKEEDRAFVLSAMRFVSAVVLFDEETPLDLIRMIRPDILVKGKDYSVENISGAAEVREHGGQVITIPLVQGYSTTSLIERIKKT